MKAPTRGSVSEYSMLEIMVSIAFQTPDGQSMAMMFRSTWFTSFLAVSQVFCSRSKTYHRLNDRSMADVHQETLLRLQSLSDRSYTVKTMWECEWLKCKNHDPERFLRH